MKMLDSAEELTNWDDYREFMKENLKLIEPGGSCYVSKGKLEFDIRGKPWFGYAFLAGKNARIVVQRLKKEGVVFKEGVCNSDGKELKITDLQPENLIKAAAKTLLKLQLGYKIAGADAETEDGAPAPAPEPAQATADSPEAAAREKKLAELQKLTKDLDRILAVLSK